MPGVRDDDVQTRIALLELGQANNAVAIAKLDEKLDDFRDEAKKANSRIVGWLIGACFTLTTSSVLLAMNLVR